MNTPEQLLSEFREIPLANLIVSSTSAQGHRRKAFDKAAIGELAASIEQLGLAQPILVRPLVLKSRGVQYEVVAGERRLLAFQKLKRESIPCTVRHLGDEQVVELQLIENLQREDLHPMHEAESYDELVRVYGRTPEEIYDKVAKSRSYFYNRLKLLSLSPACRKAFYEGAISASIAEKIARIPVHSLQDEALEGVLGFPHAKETWKRSEPLSFRKAVEFINENFTLDLSTAPFPIDDEKLNGAGPCMKCPKMAGNQPELFADAKKGNTCTDTVCFAAKTRAYGQRRIEEAKAAGVRVIVGPEAKKIAPNGTEHSYDVRDGYKLADVKSWNGSRNIEPRKLLKPGEAPALLIDPKSGCAVEVVHDKQLKKPRSEASVDNTKWQSERKEQAANAKQQTALRRAIFAALVAKGKWKAPPIRVIAELVTENMDYDAGEALMDLLGVPESKSRGFYDRLHHYVKALKSDAQLEAYVAQAYLAGELHVSSYEVHSKMPRLEAAAKAARVDVAKIRAELKPKKKPKAKAKGGRK